jgi:probable F420-dependent oxidoreductase
MKFGLTLTGMSPRWYVEASRRAERNGFESVWLGEHLILPATMPATYLYSESGQPPITPATPAYDPWALLAAVATGTDTIRLGTNVYIVPLRHPLITARSVITVDRVSGGRVTLGAGVGWLKDEFVAVGESFEDRGRRTDEILPLLRRLWTGQDPVEHHGKHYEFGPVMFLPKSLQPAGIPIEVGGTTRAAMRRAAELGDGWLELASRDVRELAHRIRTVHDLREAAGRADLPFEISSGIAQDLDGIVESERAGVTRTMVRIPLDGPKPRLDDALAWLDLFGETVIARWSGGDRQQEPRR